MSVEAIAIVLHHSRARGTAKLILVGIANHEGDGGSWPTKATLAKYANLTGPDAGKQVQKHLKALRALGEVRVHVQQGGDRDCADHDRPNRYDVLVRCPDWCDRSSNHKDTRQQGRRQLELLHRATGGKPVENRGVESDPGSNDIPGPGMQNDPQTVPLTGDTPGAALTTGHASWRPVVTDAWVPPIEAGPPCRICSRPQLQCQSSQAKWQPADRHRFEPTRGKA